jgi:hypothetical protein
MPNLQEIFLHVNLNQVTNLTMFQKLPKLRTLAWGLNNVYLLLEDFLPELDTFDSFSNRLVEFPRTCAQDGRTSLFPKLRSLDLMKNKIDTIPSRICFPSLTYLDLGGNYFPTLYTGMFRPQLFPKLEYLHLECIGTRVGYIEKQAFQNPTLKMVSLMYNDIDFSLKDLYHEDAFAGLPNITALQLSHNFFTGLRRALFPPVWSPFGTGGAVYGKLRAAANIVKNVCQLSETKGAGTVSEQGSGSPRRGLQQESKFLRAAAEREPDRQDRGSHVQPGVAE